MDSSIDIIVLGASYGGLQLIGELLQSLTVDFYLPLVIAQHQAKGSLGSFGRGSEELLPYLLKEKSALNTVLIEDKQPIESHCIYIAPHDYHAFIEGDHFALALAGPESIGCPSIDALFSSCADSYGSRRLGILFSGANHDGAAGVLNIARKGGLVFVQNPHSAPAAAMPQAAIDALRQHQIGDRRYRILELKQIADYLTTQAGQA